MADKATKEATNYRTGECCWQCKYYKEHSGEVGTCEKVEGVINEHALCDLFERK
jgi:hypothetical protein